MQKINETFQLTATDLVGRFNCRNLTELDIAFAEGTLTKPKVWNPMLDVVRELGLRHEQKFVDHLHGRGLAARGLVRQVR